MIQANQARECGGWGFFRRSVLPSSVGPMASATDNKAASITSVAGLALPLRASTNWMVRPVRLGEQRRDRVDGYLRAQIPTWSLFPLVQNLSALRGLDTIASAGLAAAIVNPSRFASAPDFMAYLGLVPSEHTSGPKRRMGAITKSGDVHARTLLIEAAHSYRFPARIARRKLTAVDAVPEAVREIAWKAQTRLCQRYRYMVAKNKPTPVTMVANGDPTRWRYLSDADP